MFNVLKTKRMLLITQINVITRLNKTIFHIHFLIWRNICHKHKKIKIEK